eukprot:7232663-Prymnesium_polylepis.1
MAMSDGGSGICNAWVRTVLAWRDTRIRLCSVGRALSVEHLELPFRFLPTRPPTARSPRVAATAKARST